MNVFIPYLDFENSVSSLDDNRLRKQILEVNQLIRLIDKSKYDHKFSCGYLNHPVTKFYKNEYNVLVCYAYCAIYEFRYRFGKKHAYDEEICTKYFQLPYSLRVFSPSVIFYHEGSNIREYDPEKSTLLFQEKLSKKFIQDFMKNRQPKWSERITPPFFQQYIIEHFDELQELSQAFDNQILAQYISNYKEK